MINASKLKIAALVIEEILQHIIANLVQSIHSQLGIIPPAFHQNLIVEKELQFLTEFHQFNASYVGNLIPASHFLFQITQIVWSKKNAQTTIGEILQPTAANSAVGIRFMPKRTIQGAYQRKKSAEMEIVY